MVPGNPCPLLCVPLWNPLPHYIRMLWVSNGMWLMWWCVTSEPTSKSKKTWPLPPWSLGCLTLGETRCHAVRILKLPIEGRVARKWGHLQPVPVYQPSAGTVLEEGLVRSSDDCSVTHCLCPQRPQARITSPSCFWMPNRGNGLSYCICIVWNC